MKINVELFKSHPAWSAVEFIANELQKRGHQAFLAGGAVRDALLGKRPKDFDIATSAQPSEVEQIFPQTVAVGKAFGVIIVRVAHESFEVATFRSDGDYKDGRRPESIEYSTPQKDSERRDFTINALFFDLKTHEVIDYQNGVSDLKLHLIRAVGDPELRFTEDKLRMLRAVRFAGQLGFKIEPTTLQALTQLKAEILVVSPERITEELTKIWQAQDPLYSFLLLKKTGLAEFVFRDFSFLKNSEVLKFFCEGLDHLARDSDLGWRWLGFCEALSRHATKTAWSNTTELLRPFSNYKLAKDLLTSIDYCLRQYHEFERRDTEALLLLDHKNGPALLQLASLERKLKNETEFYANFVDRYRALSNDLGFLQTPFINGRDIEALGVPKSPKVGELLKAVYQAQLDGLVENREVALIWLQKKLSS